MRLNDSGKKGNRNGSCDCPTEDYLNNYSNDIEQTDTAKVKYRSTRKARVQFTKNLLQEIYTCPVCKNKDLSIKHLSLAQVHELLFHAPTESALLDTIAIKDITKRKKLSDQSFEQLLNYYKKKKETIESEVTPKVSFTSFDETYFWVNTQWLP